MFSQKTPICGVKLAVQWDFWLVKKFRGVFSFHLNQTKNIYIFFLIFHELGTQSVFSFDTPGTWYFLQETIRLHPAAAGWNQRSFHTGSSSSMSPAAAGAAQVAPWASWTFPPQGFAHQQLHPSAQFHSSYPIALILTGTHMAFRPQTMPSQTSWQ